MNRSLLSATACLPLLVGLAIGGPAQAQAQPQLIAVDSSGSDTPHFGLPATPLRAPVTQLRLRFDAALATPALAAFRVVEAGADGAAATLDCAALPGGDDVDVALESLHWEATLQEATLQVAAPRGLPRGRYRVLACGALLPGGGIARHDFEIEETPTLPNPGFDRSIDGWTAFSLSGDGVVAAHDATLDADGAARSGALRLAAPTGTSALSHAGCIDFYALTGQDVRDWRLRLRYRVVTGSVAISALFWAGFSGDMGEPGCRGPGITDLVGFSAQATEDFATYDSGWRPFALMPLAGVSLIVASRDDQPFEVVFDDIGLNFDSRKIFRDDFD